MSNIVYCSYCNKEITIKPSEINKRKNNYCSRECYNLARHKNIINKCIRCGNEFEVRDVEQQFKRFCSDDCELEFKQKIENNLITINEKYRNKICKVCGKEYISFGFKGSNYCSLKCKEKFIIDKNQITLICKECNEEFKTHRKNSNFCSVSCASKNHARIQELGTKIKPKEVWNKGLDISDERIKRSAEKQKITFKKHMDEGKIKMYFKGRHLTDEHKLKVAIGQAKATLEGRKPALPCFKGGIREDLGHYVRSSWEANFGKILKYLDRQYFYEPKYFVLSNNRTYTPDFYDVKRGCYYEIKGYWTKEGKEKFELFKQDYPNIKIKLIESKQYKRLINYFNDKINFE